MTHGAPLVLRREAVRKLRYAINALNKAKTRLTGVSLAF